MSKFTRHFDSHLIKKLQSDRLFKNKVLIDIKSGNIFPAIRGGYICFYHKGGRSFKYNEKGDFETHRKYFTLLNSSKDYINRNDIKEPDLNENFIQSYDDILEKTNKYSKSEAEGVSKIYEEYPYTTFNNLDANTVILDIEIGLVPENIGENNRDSERDFIDLLLFNVKNRSLKFVEVKEFTNPDIRSQEKPRVVDQLGRYNDIIKRKESEIILAYNNYIKLVNELFDLKIPEPTKIKDECGLLIFGFDNDQKIGALKQSIENDLKNYNVFPYSIGNMGNLNIDRLWGNF